MMKFDHLAVRVSDYIRSRDWYMATLGLKVEFELPERRTVALQDSEEFAIFLQETPPPIHPNGCAMWFQVGDVDATFSEWSARGIVFAHGPHKSNWGYGAELADPDGYFVRLWDERTMKEK
jgi:predicted enzyme related to lactoylglutathione lyase